MVKLRKCPNCCSDSVEPVLSEIIVTDTDTTILFAVYCADCGLEGPQACSMEGTKSLWNKDWWLDD